MSPRSDDPSFTPRVRRDASGNIIPPPVRDREHSWVDEFGWPRVPTLEEIAELPWPANEVAALQYHGVRDFGKQPEPRTIA